MKKFFQWYQTPPRAQGFRGRRPLDTTRAGAVAWAAIFFSGRTMGRRPRLWQLSRRERQIMDAIYALGRATVAEVVRYLGDPEAHDSVRVTLAILERKGWLAHDRVEQRNVYHPTVPSGTARQSAIRHLVSTFFRGSPSTAVLAMLDVSKDRLSDEDLEEISRWIAERAEKRR
jgi:BlaI family transcriptional regulator, penicillinase repressor